MSEHRQTILSGVNGVLSQFMRFVLVGLVGTAVHYAILLAGIHGVGLSAVFASAVGFIGGAITCYVLNYSFTFCSSGEFLATGRRFAALAVSGWLVNLVLMTLFAHVLGWHYLLSQVLSTLICILFNFSGSRLWVFREVLK